MQLVLIGDPHWLFSEPCWALIRESFLLSISTDVFRTGEAASGAMDLVKSLELFVFLCGEKTM